MEVAFGAEDLGIALDLEDAAQPLPGADPMLVAAAEHLAVAALADVPRADAFVAAVSRRIAATLPASVSAEGVARELRMSARTLQRRLDAEGVRFSALLDEVRESLAKDLLRPGRDVPLAEVAYRVGFSDLATFSRAFKRWTGLPPGSYRRRA
jgi:AraC-like DNA-binding protein